MITPIYASLLALLFFALSWNVILQRRSEKISLGDQDNPEMLRRIRAQANFVEYAPFILLLALMAELQSAAGWLVHVIGLCLLVGRVAHAYALTIPKSTVSFGRIIGMILTFTALFIAAGANLIYAVLGGG